MKLTNKALRWILAVLGATAALVLTFVICRILFLVLLGAAQSSTSTSSGLAAFGFTIMCALIAWTWAGLFLAPTRYGRAALVVFSAPVAVLAIASVYELARYEQPPNRVAGGIGALVAFVAIVILGVFSRSWVRAAARPITVEEIANVFSDEVVQEAKAQE
jgi:predicted acyltransferase